MSKLLVPNDGVRGIDIQTESGVRKYDADRSGVIEVTNPIHARSLKSQGFTQAGVGFTRTINNTDVCGCGEVKFSYQVVCATCYTASLNEGTANDHSDQSDQATGDEAVSDPSRV